MSTARLLVFPLDLDESHIIVDIATRLGFEVIGASSAMPGPDNQPVNAFIKLPFVTDAAFDEAFQNAIENFGITLVYSAHQGVWRRLEVLVTTGPLGKHCTLCGPDPFSVTWQTFLPHQTWAATALDASPARNIGEVNVRPPLNRSAYTALHRQFIDIPGQCDDAKLLALTDIMRVVPSGDILEVGCLYGRSSFALGFLASRHHVGNLICVDPWDNNKVTDQGANAALLNQDRLNVDFRKIFPIFLSTIALLDNVGYIRATSADAHAHYCAALTHGYLETSELGRIALSSQLSLIHIDGNHREDFVRQDVELWTPHLAPGGWLLLDDYVWAFGDGPKQVGDTLLTTGHYDIAFVSGDTLFLRKIIDARA